MGRRDGCGGIVSWDVCVRVLACVTGSPSAIQSLSICLFALLSLGLRSIECIFFRVHVHSNVLCFRMRLRLLLGLDFVAPVPRRQGPQADCLFLRHSRWWPASQASVCVRRSGRFASAGGARFDRRRDVGIKGGGRRVETAPEMARCLSPVLARPESS